MGVVLRGPGRDIWFENILLHVEIQSILTPFCMLLVSCDVSVP